MRSLLAAIALCAALIAPASAQTRYADLSVHLLEDGNDVRFFGVYTPPNYRAGNPAPLIVALHDRFSSAKAFHAISHLQAVADARGAILLYPETQGAFWNDGGHNEIRREPALDDAGFINGAIAQAQRQYDIDPAQVFVLGYGQGGVMAQRIACESDTRFAAVAVVAALMWDYTRDACASARATPILFVHGREDEGYPRRGETIEQLGLTRLGVDDSVDFWRGVNGCAGRAADTGRGDSALYTGCSSGAPVAYVGVARGDHDWFHVAADRNLNQHGVDAASLVRSFFFDRSNFALPRENGGRRGRSWIVYAPPDYDPATPSAAVLLLHGRPSNAVAMAMITRMNEVAARRNFIVVYPDGLNNQWNAFYDIVGQRSVLPQDDEGFLEDLSIDLQRDFNIDPRRIYIGGFSNGGFMTYRLACSSADYFAGFAAVGAALYTVLTDHCRGGAPAPLLIMNGTDDQSIPYEGVLLPDREGGDPRRITLSVEETVAYFARRNHCSAEGRSTTYAQSGRSPGTHVLSFEPYECDAGKPVLFYRVNGGGHTWPGVDDVLPAESMGATNMDMNAGDIIWDFFSGLSLDQPPAR